MSSSSSSQSAAKQYEVSYSLPEEFHCEKYENSSSIVFDTEPSDKKGYKIKGFTITVTAENEEEILEKANTQAERLVQIMSFKSLGHVKYSYEGYHQKTSAGTARTVRKKFTGVYHIQPMIDELNLKSNQAISSIMQNDEETNMQLYHFRLAIGAEENRQYANMYRELFQVIEKETGLQNYQKYKALRHAISHQRPVDRAENAVITHFGAGRYNFTPNHEFDHNSKKNREHLKEDAGDLKQAVIKYLSPKL
jgi:hypothetical protein